MAPSVDEPFGQVYLEAMACRLPVIATPTGGPLSFVNTAPGRPNGWLVDPDDEAALAATLIEVVNDAPKRLARGEAAYEQIRGAYAWDTIATRVASLYEDMLATTGHVVSHVMASVASVRFATPASEFSVLVSRSAYSRCEHITFSIGGFSSAERLRESSRRATNN